MIGQNTTHANFSVDDLAAATDFYVNKLGFEMYKEYSQGAMLKSGTGTKINIYFKENHTAWDSTVLGIEVDDLEGAINELAEHGISVEKLPMTDDRGIAKDPDGGEVAWFKDPAGNWICISTEA